MSDQIKKEDLAKLPYGAFKAKFEELGIGEAFKHGAKKEVYIKKIQVQQIFRSLKDNRQYLSVTNYKRMFKELYNYMEKKQVIYGHYNRSLD